MYNTRYAGRYRKGFYTFLHDFHKFKIESKFKEKNSKKVKKNKKEPKEINDLIDTLNFEIVKRLKSVRNGLPRCSGRIYINVKLFSYIKNQFNIDKKYRNGDAFVVAYKIITQRYFNSTNVAIMENFNFKLFKGRTINYYDKDLNVKHISSRPSFYYHFIRNCKVVKQAHKVNAIL